MTPPTSKVCSKCGEEKNLSDFHNDFRKKDGVRSYCKPCALKYAQERYKSDPERFKEDAKVYRLKSLYGLSPEDLDDMWCAQSGCCAICYSALSRRSAGFAVDHNHATGEVRALLCSTCNQALGLFKDSPWITDRAGEYLRTYGYYGPQTPQGAPAPAG